MRDTTNNRVEKGEVKMEKLFMVTYKQVGRGTSKTIVRAENKERASLRFNNPAEIGLNAEIKEVKAVRKIAKGWMVTIDRGASEFPVTVKLEEELNVNDDNFEAKVGKVTMKFKVENITGAYKPVKEHKMKGRFM